MILVLRAYFLLVPMGFFGISPELFFGRAIENMTISLAVLTTQISPTWLSTISLQTTQF